LVIKSKISKHKWKEDRKPDWGNHMTTRKKNIKSPTFKLLFTSILLVCVAVIGMLLIGIYDTSDYSDDFYESQTFANYYSSRIWDVTRLAVLMNEVQNYADDLAVDEGERDLTTEDFTQEAQYRQERLNAKQRIFYKIVNEETHVVLAQSKQFEQQAANAIVLSTLYKGNNETVYHTAEKHRVLSFLDIDDDFEKSDISIVMGVSAYNETIVAHRQGELHHLFTDYYFFNEISESIDVIVIAGIVILIIAMILFVRSTKLKIHRHKNEQYDLFDVIPTDISVIFIIALGVVTMLMMLSFFKPEAIVYEDNLLMAMQYITLAFAILLVFIMLELVVALIAHMIRGTLIKKSLIYRTGSALTAFNKHLLQSLFQGRHFRRQLMAATLLIGFIVFLNILLAMMYSGWLLFLIPVDLIIAFMVIRFVLSLASIVEHFTLGDNEKTVAFKEERVIEVLKPFAYALNHMEETFNEAVANAVKGEKLKTELLTNVSHDLKTPLTAMINYIKLLKQHEHTDETIHEYVSILDMKTERLKVLVDDILEISKLSSGNIQLDLQKIDINQMMNQVMGEYEAVFSEKELEIITNDFSAPMLITADPVKLWRVFENLLTNVYKYAMPHSRVYLSTTERKKFLNIEIKNISEKPLKQFGESHDYAERFVQGDPSRQVEGSGLGLAIAKELIIQMQGSLEITTDGDLFKVSLIFEKNNQI